MALKGYSSFLRATGLDPHHQMQFSVISGIFVAGWSKMQSPCSTAAVDWVNIYTGKCIYIYIYIYVVLNIKMVLKMDSASFTKFYRSLDFTPVKLTVKIRFVESVFISVIISNTARVTLSLILCMIKSKHNKLYIYIITDAEYADDIALRANAPTETETLLHSLERAAVNIGLNANAHKTEYMCFNQRGDNATLNGSLLK